MAVGPKELLPSFLDRLIDAGVSGDSGQVVYSLEQMIDTVRADLEELLNTRQSRPLHDCPYPNVKESILAYGLPDVNSIPGATIRDSEVVCEHIKRLIELFEPRLKNVHVEMNSEEIPGDNSKEARYQISGELNVDPAPEVGFETIVEIASGQTKVQISSGLS